MHAIQRHINFNQAALVARSLTAATTACVTTCNRKEQGEIVWSGDNCAEFSLKITSSVLSTEETLDEVDTLLDHSHEAA